MERPPLVRIRKIIVELEITDIRSSSVTEHLGNAENTQPELGTEFGDLFRDNCAMRMTVLTHKHVGNVSIGKADVTLTYEHSPT